jgi:hypothetical protein
MSRRKARGVPVAPARLPGRVIRRWARLGKRDASRYGALQDFTRTHALIEAVKSCQSHQHAVNDWLIREIEPERTGNLRIQVKTKLDQERLNELRSLRLTSLREQSRANMAIDRLELQIANAHAQMQANVVKGNSKILIAVEAMGTWVNYYQQLAAVYTRARANRRFEDVSSVEAEIPHMESIEVVEIDGFENVNDSVAKGAR